MCRDWMRVNFEVPLVHFFLNVLVQLVQLALQLLPPLLRRQVAEVFWSGALSDTTGRRGGVGGGTDGKRQRVNDKRTQVTAGF